MHNYFSWQLEMLAAFVLERECKTLLRIRFRSLLTPWRRGCSHSRALSRNKADLH